MGTGSLEATLTGEDSGEPAVARPAALPSERLGPYRLLRYLGAGAMGVVYEAIDDEFGDRVAVKTLSRLDARRLFRLKQEFRTLAGVRHDNLVRHDALICDGGSWFLAMEFVDGTDIVRAVRRDPGGLRSALAQLARGVVALHEAGVLHLDLKPANVLVERSGRVVILDFGLAQGWLSRPGDPAGGPSPAGTPGYIAPELLAGGAPGRASDWFAAGKIVAELLAAADESSGELAALCERLCAPDPAARPDAREVLGLLAPTAGGRRDVIALPELVGRTDELAALRAALAATRPGEPGLVLVAGESGVGKTALVRRFLAELERSGAALVLAGRCHECESVPFAGLDPVVDALARRLAAVRLPTAEVAACAALFPVLSNLSEGPYPDVEPTAEVRAAAFLGLRALLARAAGGRPLVLAIDDLHLARADTAALLLDLLADADDGLVLLAVATCRNDLADSSECLRELAARAAARGQKLRERQVAVRPLAADACAALVRAYLGGEREAELERLVEESGGNAYLAESLARAAAGGPVRAVADLVRWRMEALAPEAQRLLATVALSGRPLPQAVLLRAAGVASPRSAWQALRADSLVRVNGSRRWDTVEPFHDRIRDGVAAALAPAHKLELHRALAQALEGEDHGAPELRMRHWAAGGELRRAGDYAEQAAAEAEQALAFERAASLFATAAEWSAEDEQRAALRLRQGRALMRAGRSAAAAEAYLDGAALDHGERRRDAERLAAEAWMAAGHVDRGLSILRPMLADEGLAWPGSSVRAGLALLWDYARLRARGTALAGPAAAADERSRRHARRSDLCWSIGMGLTNVMPLWGMLFAVRGLVWALESGDRGRVGRCLAVFGAFHRLLGRAAVGERYLQQARALAESLGDAQLLGLSHVCSAGDAMLTGDWREVVTRTQQGLAALPARSIGVTWERMLGACFELAALDQLGVVAEVERRAREHLHDAEARGDLYGQVVSHQFVGQSRIAAGDTAGARAHARASLERWAPGEYTLQHFYALRIEVGCDLYDGQAAVGRSRLATTWPRLRAAGLLQNPISRVDALLLRARCALATADGGEALALARKLERERRVDAGLHARWIRARAGAADADRLREAERGFASRGMALCSAGAAKILALGSSAAEDAAIASLGVVDPDRWMRYFMPELGVYSTERAR